MKPPGNASAEDEMERIWNYVYNRQVAKLRDVATVDAVRAGFTLRGTPGTCDPGKMSLAKMFKYKAKMSLPDFRWISLLNKGETKKKVLPSKRGDPGTVPYCHYGKSCSECGVWDVDW